MAARIAALSRWAGEPDRPAATAPARRGLRLRFEHEVDPEGILSPEERARRANLAMRAHMVRMSLASSRVRARRRSR